MSCDQDCPEDVASPGLHTKSNQALQSYSAFAGLSDPILVIDKNGLIVWCNAVAEKFFATRLIGKRAADITSLDTNRFTEAKSSTESVREICHYGVSSLNVGNEVEWSINYETEASHYVLVGRVRSELYRETEGALRRELEKAKVASRMKSEFLAHMSHEIRTPMNGVVGMAELLLETELTDEQLELTRAVQVSADSLLNVINDILDFSKMEAGKIEILPRACIIEDLFKKIELVFLTQALKKKIEFTCVVSEEVPEIVLLDPDRLKQVLINLIGNAMKFTQSGVVVLHIGVDTESDCLEFIVVDSGDGIDTESQQAIFESFSQAGPLTQRHGGTGLGLTISARLVSMMGGNLQLRSRKDVGSVFFFTIPLQEVVLDEDGRRKSGLFDRYVPPRKNLHILLAEDNAVNQKLTVSILEKAGHTVTVVHNGREAVECVPGGGFDLVLMDIKMPEMNGDEAARKIREMVSGKDIPVIALTAHAMSGDREKFLAAGMDAYLSKPFKKKELLQLIGDVLSMR
ncbi:MAG: response regulator [Bdellovibrionales bacterium]|nr:response regulator [Bdellovibrionales bacterium]